MNVFITRHASFIVWLATSVVVLNSVGLARACPFCLAIEPTLAQRRESADAVALGEAGRSRAGEKLQPFYLHRVFKGPAGLKKREAISAESTSAETGTLAILFATADEKRVDADRWDWSTVFANEALLGYFAAAPDLRQPPAKRLAYFVKFLEHADRDIARDAYLEFAHAPYEDVLAVADKFDFAAVRSWLASPGVPDERKGFYGMVLGLAKNDADRAANLALLEQRIRADASDFRAGFDGLLAGYLLLAGKDGLKLVTSRYLDNARARHGDVRHAMSALRFYYDYGPKELRPPIARAAAGLIERPEFAAAAVVDVARWENWELLDKVAALYQARSSDGPTRRAVIGYLKVCPLPQAAETLERIRKEDAAGVEAIEKSLFLPGAK